MATPKRRSGAGGKSGIIDRTKYEVGATYTSTKKYSYKAEPDPEGQYRDEKNERYSIVETYAENAGFKEIRSAPAGSIVVVRQPTMTWSREGKVPAHDEYYEISQHTKSMRTLTMIRTTDKQGRYYWKHGMSKANNYGEGAGPDVTTVKAIQEWFKYARRITIYRPKKMPE